MGLFNALWLFGSGVIVGIIITLIGAIATYRNNRRKIDDTIFTLLNSSLSPEQKVAKLMEIWGIRL